MARVALITGVTRLQGIGAAIAFALARAGVNICVGYWRPYDRRMPWGVRDTEPEEIVNAVRQAGVRACGFEVDLSEPSGPQLLFQRAYAEFGGIDILVNNAAYATESAVDDLTAETLDSHYTVNLRAMMLLCAEFVRSFKQGQGRIINLTSGQGLGPLPNELAYAATKGGVEAFSLSLSAAVASRGITVNAFDPGPTETGWMIGELKESLIRSAPMGRLGTPADAANVVAFLVSEEAQWVTGQIIRSRGGN